MVRPRTEEVADIDRDSGADGPLSCLRSKEDPGRNRGRAAATGPVIANGVRRGRGRGKGRGRGGQGAGELQRDQRQQSSRRTVPSLVVPVVCSGWSAVRTRHFFNATSGHSPDRGGSGSLPWSSRPAGPGGGADPRQSKSHRQGSSGQAQCHHRSPRFRRYLPSIVCWYNYHLAKSLTGSSSW